MVFRRIGRAESNLLTAAILILLYGLNIDFDSFIDFTLDDFAELIEADFGEGDADL